MPIADNHKVITHVLMLAALLVAGAAFVSCDKQNAVAEYTMTVIASKGDNGAKQLVLGGDGHTLNASWAEGEQVTVYNVTKSAALEGYLEPKSIDGASATLSGTLTGDIEDDDVLTLKFLSPNYTSQTGTLEYIAANCDYAEATVTVASVSGGNITTTANANFENKQAIAKFTLKNNATDAAINATQLVVSDGTNSYTVTSNPATDVLYIAIPGFSGQTVTLTANVGGKPFRYQKEGASFTNGQYYEITVKMTETDFFGSGTSSDPYLITSNSDWNTLATKVNSGTSYSDMYFKLNSDIEAGTMVGTSDHKFSGTFDGNGYTLTFNQSNATEQYIAPFRYINSATIQNLKVAGTVSTSNKFAGGVVAHAVGSNTITNCVNSTIINATSAPSNNGSHGGILGQLGGSNNSVTISGCLFNGQMQGSSVEYWCGIIGYYGSNVSRVTISNCYFNPEEVNVKSSNNNYTICRPGPTVTNCYYNAEGAEMSQKQGKQAHSITNGDGVTISGLGTVSATYNNSGITAYAHGIKYGEVYYAGYSDDVALNLSFSKPGCTFTSYTASGGTLTNPTTDTPTLTMPNANVIVGATYTTN